MVGVVGRLGDGERRLVLVLGFASCCAPLRVEDLVAEAFCGICLLAGVGRFAEALVGAAGVVVPLRPLVEANRFFGGLDCCPCNAFLVILLSPRCSSIGMVLMRPDFLRPSSAVNVDGPSASIFFHGGDSGLRRRALLLGVVSRTRRRFAGGSSSSESSSRVCPLMPLPLG